jgi:hypothetical protein
MDAVADRIQRLVIALNTYDADNLLTEHISNALLITLIERKCNEAALYAIKTKFTSVRMNRDALATAVVFDNTVLACLLEHCDACSMDTNTKLIGIAAQRNNVDGARLLLAFKPLQPTDLSNILDVALEANNPGIIELLLQYAEGINKPIDIGRALVSAAKMTDSRRTSILRTLLAGRGTTFTDYKYVKALDWIVNNNNVEQLKMMLANPNVDLYVETYDLLAKAIRKNSAVMIDILMADPRVDPTKMVEGWSAIDVALVDGSTATAINLFAHPKLDSSTDRHQMLIKAIECNRLYIVEYLLNDPRVEMNNRIIHAAYSRNVNDDVRKLVTNDSRVNMSDPKLLELFAPVEIVTAITQVHKNELDALKAKIKALLE